MFAVSRHGRFLNRSAASNGVLAGPPQPHCMGSTNTMSASPDQLGLPPRYPQPYFLHSVGPGTCKGARVRSLKANHLIVSWNDALVLLGRLCRARCAMHCLLNLRLPELRSKSTCLRQFPRQLAQTLNILRLCRPVQMSVQTWTLLQRDVLSMKMGDKARADRIE